MESGPAFRSASVSVFWHTTRMRGVEGPKGDCPIMAVADRDKRLHDIVRVSDTQFPGQLDRGSIELPTVDRSGGQIYSFARADELVQPFEGLGVLHGLVLATHTTKDGLRIGADNGLVRDHLGHGSILAVPEERAAFNGPIQGSHLERCMR
jgi:hypothetical protein